MNVRLASAGDIRMSRGVSSLSDVRTFCVVRMLRLCDVSPRMDVSCSFVFNGVPMFTAITMSAPIAFTTSIGRLLTMPPSPSSRPLTSNGSNRPGTDMLARIATYSGPRSNTISSPVTMSVATARNGMGNWSKLASLSSARVSWCR